MNNGAVGDMDMNPHIEFYPLYLIVMCYLAALADSQLSIVFGGV